MYGVGTDVFPHFVVCHSPYSSAKITHFCQLTAKISEKKKKTSCDFCEFGTENAVPEATGGGQGVDEKNFVRRRNKFALRTKFFSSADEIRHVLSSRKKTKKTKKKFVESFLDNFWQFLSEGKGIVGRDIACLCHYSQSVIILQTSENVARRTMGRVKQFRLLMCEPLSSYVRYACANLINCQ